MAGAFSLLVVPRLLTGNQPIPTYGVTPLQIIAGYLAAGICGGLIVALLYPLKQWFLGAFFIGMLAALPAYLGPAVLMRGNDPWSVTLSIGLVAAFFVGGGVGSLIASESYGRPIPSSQLVLGLWGIVVVCQVVGWYLGMRWPGEVRATVGLGLVFMPPYVAALATFSRRRGDS
jgi:hypothetical protein